MSATSGSYVPAGQGWRLAYSLVTLAHELADVFGDQLTCLGTVGDVSHQAEGMSSDHNPFIRDPAAPSIGIVRAIDFGGSDALLKQIRQHIWDLYAAQDSRVYVFGYSKGCSDNLINNWGLPFGTHVDTGDAGHLHVSVTQMNGYAPSSSGYVAAIDSTAGWGFAGSSPSSGGTPIDGDGMDNGDFYNLLFSPITAPSGAVIGTGLDLIVNALRPKDASQESYQAGAGAALWAAYEANTGDAAALSAYQNGYNDWAAQIAAPVNTPTPPSSGGVVPPPSTVVVGPQSGTYTFTPEASS